MRVGVKNYPLGFDLFSNISNFLRGIGGHLLRIILVVLLNRAKGYENIVECLRPVCVLELFGFGDGPFPDGIGELL